MDHWPHIITPLKLKAEGERQEKREGGKEREGGERGVLLPDSLNKDHLTISFQP